jgi:peptidyl-prolyl cis-trans isomerase SurA
MRYTLLIVVMVASLSSQAQTLFTYGSGKVDKKEFWRAYSKNNNGATDEQSIREYLDLFIRFKLKVQAAKDAKLDTLPGIQNDMAAFRAQMIEQFMRNQGSGKALVVEAIERNATEIEVAHVFVGYDADSAKAKASIDKAYSQLQSGADFTATVRSFSSNEYVKSSNGYIGYITVFSLPYELENLVYSTPVGKYSKPVAGRNGYHIFKVLNKRPAPGKMKAAQILVALPANASQEEISTARKRVEMIYGLLQKGEKFETLVPIHSDDKLTYLNGGELPEFTFAKYDAAFGKAAFALEKDGAISVPIQTSIGFHIIKRIRLTPLNADKNDPLLLQEMTEKVNADSRIRIAINQQKEQILKNSQYKLLPYNEQQVWTITDTMLKAKNYAAVFTANQKKSLFQLGSKLVSVADWLKHVKSLQTTNYTPQRSEYPALMKQFTDLTAEQYYKDRLEHSNEEVGAQVQEFREGSLLFEIMERKIWGVAPTDSVGLTSYYNNNKQRYQWQPSVNAIVFNCADTSVANQAFAMMKKDPLNWKEYMEQFGGMALADSSRFEFHQLPSAGQGNVKAGTFTAVTTNPNDGSVSFSFILKVYPTPEPRSFEEAKGLVINDYQIEMEEKWISQLKKKYPVKVNEAVLKSLLK